MCSLMLAQLHRREGHRLRNVVNTVGAHFRRKSSTCSMLHLQPISSPSFIARRGSKSPIFKRLAPNEGRHGHPPAYSAGSSRNWSISDSLQQRPKVGQIPCSPKIRWGQIRPYPAFTPLHLCYSHATPLDGKFFSPFSPALLRLNIQTNTRRTFPWTGYHGFEVSRPLE